ncbi:hypothetical protein [Daejeonella sp.]|uniref:hypothetical protein n=1 Tax=Daejeonella sp. TaxID=2805397 RepID=UPI0039830B1D
MHEGQNIARIYIKCDFQCAKCNHKTTVLIDNKYTLFDLYEVDRHCNSCGLEKEFVCEGTLIERYDWPDTGDDPWQLQCVYVPEEEKYCTDCRDEEPIPDDWRKLVVACSQCDGDMVSIE